MSSGKIGDVVQRLEHRPVTPEVAGSNPVVLAKVSDSSELRVRRAEAVTRIQTDPVDSRHFILDRKWSGCGFDPSRSHQDTAARVAHAFVVQWIEHLASNQAVGGSSPSERAKNKDCIRSSAG